MNGLRAVSLLVLLSVIAPVRAEGWLWSATPFLWAAGIDGTISTGVLDADFPADFEDIVNIFEGALILGVEAQSDRNLLFSDIVSLALGSLAADVDALIPQGGYGRALSEGFRIEAGARYWAFDTRLDSSIAATVEHPSDWLDVFAGVRIDSSVSDPLSLGARALDIDLDEGGSQPSDLNVRFAGLTVGYTFTG